MIKAVIFDMDGILVDSEPLHLQQIKDFYEENGKKTTEEFLCSLVGRSDHDTWDSMKEMFQEDITLEEYRSRFQIFKQKHPINYSEAIFPFVKDVLEQLKKRGYRMAIASSSPVNGIEKVMKQCGMDSYFDLKLSGEMFTHSKPDPEIYETAVQKLGLKKEECVIVEDSKYGIEAGKRAGVCVIARVDHRYGADANEADAQFETYDTFMNLIDKLENEKK